MTNRWKALLANRLTYGKRTATIVFMSFFAPFMVIVLFKDFKMPGKDLLSMGVGFVYSFTAGMSLLTIFGEEKEKKQLKSLWLSGVTIGEYLGSTLFFPLLVSLIYVIGLPLYLDVSIDLWLVYGLTNIGIVLFFAFSNTAIGLFAKGVNYAMPYGFVLMMSTIFLPMVASMPKKWHWILDWSYLGAQQALLNDPKGYSLISTTGLTLGLWVLLGVVMIYLAARYTRRSLT